MKTISIIVIVGSFILFQVHSAFAWIEISGNWTGVLWAIMFEVSAFYFIFSGNSKLGISAYIMVLLMASFSISKDARSKLETNINDKTLEVLVNTLDNIKSKDYPITIQKTMKAISEVKEDSHKSKSIKIKWSLWLGILLQVVALSFVLVAQIKAIMYVRNETPKEKVKQVVTMIETDERNHLTTTSKALLAKSTLRQLEVIMINKKVPSETQLVKHFGNDLGISKATFPRLKAVANGGDGISEKAMNEIQNKIKNYKGLL